MIRAVRTGCVIAALFGFCPAFAAKPGDEADITRAIVTGYPDSTAIIDKTGLFTRGYLKNAKHISENRVPLVVDFPAIVHSRESTCQGRFAYIYPEGRGFMIIEQSEFFPALAAAEGKFPCNKNSEIVAVLAPSLETYMLGLWAMAAIRPAVIAKAGSEDDPLCLEVSAVTCPAPDLRAARYDGFKLWRVSMCSSTAANCIAISANFFEERPSGGAGSVTMRYEVRYSQGKRLRSRAVTSFKAKQEMYLPSVGTPRVLKTLPGSN